MSEHPNVELARRGYAAFGSGDMQTLTELIADDAVWHTGGRHALSGVYEGRDAIFGFFAELAQRSEGTFSVEVHDILANDDHAVVLTTVRAAGSGGKTLMTHSADTSHIRDGKVVEYWSFAEDPYAFDDYFSV